MKVRAFLVARRSWLCQYVAVQTALLRCSTCSLIHWDLSTARASSFCIVSIADFQVHTKLVFVPFSLIAWVSFGVRQLAIQLQHALGYTFIRHT